jgi:hypothetical protein
VPQINDGLAPNTNFPGAMKLCISRHWNMHLWSKTRRHAARYSFAIVLNAVRTNPSQGGAMKVKTEIVVKLIGDLRT